MNAQVVGIKKIDFQSQTGPVKMIKYFCVVDTGEADEGMEVDTLAWNEINQGPPPAIKVKDSITVAYGKNGKLRLSQ